MTITRNMLERELSEHEEALIAGQLADLTHVVEETAKQLQRLLEAAASQQTRADVRQERIDLYLA